MGWLDDPALQDLVAAELYQEEHGPRAPAWASLSAEGRAAYQLRVRRTTQLLVQGLAARLEAYLQEMAAATDQERHRVAERYGLEALPTLRSHANGAVILEAYQELGLRPPRAGDLLRVLGRTLATLTLTTRRLEAAETRARRDLPAATRHAMERKEC